MRIRADPDPKHCLKSDVEGKQLDTTNKGEQIIIAQLVPSKDLKHIPRSNLGPGGLRTGWFEGRQIAL